MIEIRQFQQADLDQVLTICIDAFTPIHESFRQILGSEIFFRVYPDWKESNKAYIRSLCEDDRDNVLVATTSQSEQVVGFVHYSVNPERCTSEIGINAVAPELQGKGIGAKMYEHVLRLMAENDVKVVEVSTGGDASHTAARRSYEKLGFVPLPYVRYYKTL